uniref:omega-amidase n=1 Tax=Ixodes ricinus TaxID=34613 RepID=A0A147BK64_IXORI
MTSNQFRVALLQLTLAGNKKENMWKATTAIKKAADSGAQMVCLPAGFACPNGSRNYLQSAETVPGETSEMLSHSARESNVYLVGGTMIEQDGGNMFKTCLVYGPDGSLVAKYRKLHLFDIEVPGKLTHRESDVITPGDKLAVFETPFCKVGLGICYDLRYPQLAQAYADLGCKLLVFPGAFNRTMGSLHWELLQRARAADNQVYVATVSSATNELMSYVAWGHSMLVDPQGKVVQSAGHDEAVVMGVVDLDHLCSVRKQEPLWKQRRDDIYRVQ